MDMAPSLPLPQNGNPVSNVHMPNLASDPGSGQPTLNMMAQPPGQREAFVAANRVAASPSNPSDVGTVSSTTAYRSSVGGVPDSYNSFDLALTNHSYWSKTRSKR
jgi:hypothetical protein